MPYYEWRLQTSEGHLKILTDSQEPLAILSSTEVRPHGYHYTYPGCGHKFPLSDEPIRMLQPVDFVPMRLDTSTGIGPGVIGEPAKPKTFSPPVNRKNPFQQSFKSQDQYQNMSATPPLIEKLNDGRFRYGGWIIQQDPQTLPFGITHPDLNRGLNLDPFAAIAAGQASYGPVNLDPSFSLGYPLNLPSCPRCTLDEYKDELDQQKRVLEQIDDMAEWSLESRNLALAVATVESHKPRVFIPNLLPIRHPESFEYGLEYHSPQVWGVAGRNPHMNMVRGRGHVEFQQMYENFLKDGNSRSGVSTPVPRPATAFYTPHSKAQSSNPSSGSFFTPPTGQNSLPSGGSRGKSLKANAPEFRPRVHGSANSTNTPSFSSRGSGASPGTQKSCNSHVGGAHNFGAHHDDFSSSSSPGNAVLTSGGNANHSKIGAPPSRGSFSAGGGSGSASGIHLDPFVDPSSSALISRPLPSLVPTPRFLQSNVPPFTLTANSTFDGLFHSTRGGHRDASRRVSRAVPIINPKDKNNDDTAGGEMTVNEKAEEGAQTISSANDGVLEDLQPEFEQLGRHQLVDGDKGNASVVLRETHEDLNLDSNAPYDHAEGEEDEDGGVTLD